MKLQLYQTFQVQRKIEEIVQEIGDTKVLAKLSAGDRIAIKLKYYCTKILLYYCILQYEQSTLTCNMKCMYVCMYV